MTECRINTRRCRLMRVSEYLDLHSFSVVVPWNQIKQWKINITLLQVNCIAITCDLQFGLFKIYPNLSWHLTMNVIIKPTVIKKQQYSQRRNFKLGFHHDFPWKKNLPCKAHLFVVFYLGRFQQVISDLGILQKWNLYRRKSMVHDLLTKLSHVVELHKLLAMVILGRRYWSRVLNAVVAGRIKIYIKM